MKHQDLQLTPAVFPWPHKTGIVMAISNEGTEFKTLSQWPCRVRKRQKQPGFKHEQCPCFCVTVPHVYFWNFFACHCAWHLFDAIIIVKQTDKMVLRTSNELPINPEVCKHNLRLVGVLKPWIWGWKVRVKFAQSCLTLCDPTDYTVHSILQAWIMEWVPFPSPGELPNPGIKPRSPALQADSLPNPSPPHCRRILYQLSHKGSPGILEWVAYPFSRGSSQPRNQIRVSCIADGFFTSWAIREAHMNLGLNSLPYKVLAKSL